MTTAPHALPLDRRRVPRPAVVAAAVAGAVVLLRVLDVGDTPAAQTFTLMFTAIVVEALPFVLLGAVVSAAIEVFVGDRSIARVARLPLWLQVPASALGGAVFPVCECGSVPVARRLITKGIHPAAGITFMLAAPIFNPVVLAATWVAYAPRELGWQMLGARAVGGIALAVAVGWALGAEGATRVLRASNASADDGPHHPRARRFMDHLTTDFLFMGKFLVVGAAFAAALQTAIPQSAVGGVATTPVIGTLALMAVAYIASLCSEADAFVAVSFAQFPLGAQLGFLLFGPVLDLKLSFLYSATFKRRFVLRLATVAIPVTLAVALLFEVASP